MVAVTVLALILATVTIKKKFTFSNIKKSKINVNKSTALQTIHGTTTLFAASRREFCVGHGICVKRAANDLPESETLNVLLIVEITSHNLSLIHI